MNRQEGNGEKSGSLAERLMRNTEGATLWLIMATTFCLLVGYQYWIVPEAFVVKYGMYLVLKGAMLAALGQLIALLVPVMMVVAVGLTWDRMTPLTPD